MSTTLLNAEVELSKQLGDYWASTTTGAGSATTMVDTALKDKANDWVETGEAYVFLTEEPAGAVGQAVGVRILGRLLHRAGEISGALGRARQQTNRRRSGPVIEDAEGGAARRPLALAVKSARLDPPVIAALTLAGRELGFGQG